MQGRALWGCRPGRLSSGRSSPFAVTREARSSSSASGTISTKSLGVLETGSQDRTSLLSAGGSWNGLPGAYLGRRRLPVPLPIVSGAGPAVTLQETAKARQVGWPTLSLHVNVPGSVSWLWPRSTFPEGVGEETFFGLHGDGPCGSPEPFAFFPLRTITLLMRILSEQTFLACPAPSQI